MPPSATRHPSLSSFPPYTLSSFHHSLFIPSLYSFFSLLLSPFYSILRSLLLLLLPLCHIMTPFFHFLSSFRSSQLPDSFHLTPQFFISAKLKGFVFLRNVPTTLERWRRSVAPTISTTKVTQPAPLLQSHLAADSEAVWQVALLPLMPVKL